MKKIIFLLILYYMIIYTNAYNNICNGNGKYINNKCKCKYNYINKNCDTKICNVGSKLEITCNIKGGICSNIYDNISDKIIKKNINTKSKCICKYGYYGNDCSIKKIYSVKDLIVGDYSGKLKIFPLQPKLNLPCQLSNSTCKSYNIDISTLNIFSSKILLKTNKVNTYSQCPELPPLTLEINNINITNNYMFGSFSIKLSQTSTLLYNVSFMKMYIHSDNNNHNITFNIAHPNVSPINNFDPKNYNCTNDYKIFTLEISKKNNYPSNSFLFTYNLYIYSVYIILNYILFNNIF